MATELQLHPVQAEILKVLLFKPTARFSDLNTGSMSTDHFTFHVKKLVEAGMIEKMEEGEYRLTVAGKEFANRFDAEDQSMKIERQAKLGVRVCPIRVHEGKTQYLLEQRLKQPYFGFWGFVGGKIKWGETIYEAAARELKEEAGIEGDLKLVRIKHKMDYAPDGSFLEDKYFFVLRADNVHGDHIESYEGGRNTWLTRQEIENTPDLYPDVLSGLDALDNPQPDFTEKKYTADKY